jgi:hypothetical protein
MPEYGIRIVKREGDDICQCECKCGLVGWFYFDTEEQMDLALKLIGQVTNTGVEYIKRAFLMNHAIRTVFDNKWLDINTATLKDIRKYIKANPPVMEEEFEVQKDYYGILSIRDFVDILYDDEETDDEEAN